MLLGLFCGALPCFAEQVNLQLKWQHQFQFAGYYAALEQGYYRDEGLDVNIIPATPGVNPDHVVLHHHAQYGVGTSNIVLLRQRGEPVVVLAVIFQHSAFAIATRADSDIRSIKDLRGKRFMQEYGSADIDALLQREGILPDQYQAVPHSFDVSDLISGHVDAMTVYKTDEVFELLQRGVPYRLFEPQLAGVNFYGDNLYTTEDELQRHPQRVKAFVRASLKGWQYAMMHVDEMITLIQQRYHSSKSRQALKFEADTMESLMVLGIIPPGYMYEHRWRDIVKTYQDLGYLKPDFKLEGMLYHPTPSVAEQLWAWRWYAAGAVAGLLVLLLLLYTTVLRHQINRRTLDLYDSNQRLQSTFDRMQEVLFRTDIAGNILSVSPSAEALLGYNPVTLIEKNVASYYCDATERAKLIAAVQADGVIANYRICMKHHSGNPVWVSVNAHVYYSEDGAIKGIEGVTRRMV
jgi:PAS domain S-box-containing protein